ncbi:MAG: hypothetical protein M1522_02175 [Actinobacteria bacterium]|nr:hypothetical protein [Actinomycetota bacterium]
MRTRVVVVDNSHIGRRGTAELLADHPEIEIAAALDHDEALVRDSWDDVDAVIVDGADEGREDDHFPGVAVVEAIRRKRSPQETRIVVVTARYLHPGLRRRMREAQADRFYNRFELEVDTEALVRAVLGTDAEDRGSLAPLAGEDEALRELGVARGSRVNDAVAFARDSRLDALFSGRAGSIGRRSLITLRRRFNKVARLTPINKTNGNMPDRNQDLPSQGQIERFLEATTKVENPPPAPPKPGRR